MFPRTATTQLSILNVHRLIRDMPTAGNMFTYDDAILDLHSLSAIDDNASWLTFDRNPIIKYVTNTALVMKDGWSWINGPWGAKVLLYAVSNPEFSTKYNANLLMCTPKDQLEVGRGQGDVFFNSSQHYPIFQKASILFWVWDFLGNSGPNNC